MTKLEVSSYERVMSAIGHQEADRVPLFLLLSTYGAKELQMPIKEYFSSARNVVEAQLRMKEKYQNDCLYSFFYAPIEVEAWGGEVIFMDDGPPNSGDPIIKRINQISSLEPPRIEETPCLLKVLDTTEQLKQAVGNTTPIIGVVMSPFSLPIMQMGFEKYLQLIYFHKEEFARLMRTNIEFCVSWANAQLRAGATAICYFDPLASPNNIERNTYLTTGYEVARETLSRINGPIATHLASGITLPVIDDIIQTGASVLGFSCKDDLGELKKAAKNRICLLGNLNALDMMNWSTARLEDEVKQIISKAGKGGGLILADNHGDVPWQVPEDVLLTLSEAVRHWGQYPLKWVEEYENA